MEVYAIGLAIIVGLIWLIVRLSRNAGRTEAELDTARDRILGAEAKHEKELEINKLSSDAVNKRGSKWMRKTK